VQHCSNAIIQYNINPYVPTEPWSLYWNPALGSQYIYFTCPNGEACIDATTVTLSVAVSFPEAVPAYVNSGVILGLLDADLTPSPNYREGLDAQTPVWWTDDTTLSPDPNFSTNGPFYGVFINSWIFNTTSQFNNVRVTFNS
jgi:hypothetical protein